MFRPSLGQSRPLDWLLSRVVKDHLVRTSGVKLRLPAVNLNTGELRIYTQSDELRKAAMASSSYPIIFPPIKDLGKREDGHCMYMDGGLRDISPLSHAIKEGASDITIINLEAPLKKQRKLKNLLQVGTRCMEIMLDEILANDIRYCKKINELVDRAPELKKLHVIKHTTEHALWQPRKIKLTIIRPEESLGNPLDFSPELTKERFERGWERAKEIVLIH